MILDIKRNQNNTYTITEELLKTIINNLVESDLKNDLFSALYKKYNFGLNHEDYCLYKVYNTLTEWTQEEINLIKMNFPDNFYIERPIRYDNLYLSISDDGINNRPWTEDELKLIERIFYGQ
jgi:hypothetical protein